MIETYIPGIGAYLQKTPYTCGPACLKIVMQYFGKRIAEKKLASISNCNPILGTTHLDMIRTARKMGYTVRYKQFTSIKEIEKSINAGIPVIVDYLQHEDGHYSVITGYNSRQLKIIDPGSLLKKSRRIERSDFLKWWNYGIQFDSGFNDPKEDSLKWSMLMIPRQERYKLGSLFME